MFVLSRVFAELFAGIFTTGPEYISLSAWGIRVFTLMVVPLAFQYTFVDSLTALGMTRLSLGLSLFRKALYLLAVCLLPFALSPSGAFYAEPLADGISAAASTAVFLSVYFRFLRKPGSLFQPR